MPFINGRYYMNPVVGQAIEAAREAEAALENHAEQNSGAHDDDFFGEPNRASAQENDADHPIHRIEIEAAEMVPAHSGRAARGFVARVHRAPVAPSRGVHAAGLTHGATAGGRAETHVFADHRDLVNFLRDELAKSLHASGRSI